MPTPVASPTIITAAELATAAGITGDCGPGYQVTDGYGVTYTGTPAHLALLALGRRDLTGGLYPQDRTAYDRVIDTAHTLIDWFTSPYLDPQHAAVFASMSPLRVCELVAYVATHGEPIALSHVGPESLRYYTEHLTSDHMDNPDRAFPRVVDTAYRSLSGAGAGFERAELAITATAADGADEVAVPLHIEASEAISWSFTAAIPIPTAELTTLLMDPDYFLDDYLSDNRDLIDDHLTYRDSTCDQGLTIDATLAGPDAIAIHPDLQPPPEPLASVALFFVGPDHMSATVATPFLDRAAAESAAAPAGHRVFTTTVSIQAAAVYTA